MNKDIKKILMIAFSFPPHTNVGIYRTMRFLKNLPTFKYEPVLLTVRHPNLNAEQDSELLKTHGIPQKVKVHRTYFINLIPPGRTHNSKPNNKNQVLNNSEKYSFLISMISRLKIKYIKLISKILVPDIFIGWIPFALIRGLRLINENNIKFIYATGSPFSDFVIGYLLKVITNKPLVIDYRDPWTWNPMISLNKLSGYFARKLEKMIISKADAILVVGENMKKMFVRKFKELYGQDFNKKIFYIYNGYDEKSFNNIKVLDKSFDGLKIVYAGKFYGNRTPKYFIRAVYELIKNGSIDEKKINIRFLGPINNEVIKMVRDLNIENVINIYGLIPQKETFHYLNNSDILLFINGGEEYDNINIPAKIFEYLRIGKYILGLTSPNSESANIIKRAKAGSIVHPYDIHEIKKIILELYNNFLQKGFIENNPDKKYIKNFEGRNLTQKLNDIINDISMKEVYADK